MSAASLAAALIAFSVVSSPPQAVEMPTQASRPSEGASARPGAPAALLNVSTSLFEGGWDPRLGADNLGFIPGVTVLPPEYLALPVLARPPSEEGSALPDLPGIPIPTTFAPLKSASAGTGRLIGAIHNEGRVFDLNEPEETARYEAHLVEQYDLITPENGCKAAPIFPTGLSEPRWAACDRIVNWTEANSLKIRFHGARLLTSPLPPNPSSTPAPSSSPRPYLLPAGSHGLGRL